jgi:hypothetical protein
MVKILMQFAQHYSIVMVPKEHGNVEWLEWCGIQISLEPLENGLFTQTLRYAQNFILGILTIYLR